MVTVTPLRLANSMEGKDWTSDIVLFFLSSICFITPQTRQNSQQSY